MKKENGIIEKLPQYIKTKDALKTLPIIVGTCSGIIEIINATTNRIPKIYIGVIMILGGIILGIIIETGNKLIEQQEEEEEKRKWQNKKKQKQKKTKKNME